MMSDEELYALVHEVLKEDIKTIDVREASASALDIGIHMCETYDEDPDMMRVKRLKLIELKCERIRRNIIRAVQRRRIGP